MRVPFAFAVAADLAVDEAVGRLTAVKVVQRSFQREAFRMVLRPKCAETGVPEKDVLERSARAQPRRQQGGRRPVKKEFLFGDLQRRPVKSVHTPLVYRQEFI